ncbi:MAG: exo-alpha-sialidase [Clostridia bacterium]|nr:exo-alpha-sialidase [Clostridia bacterium]
MKTVLKRLSAITLSALILTSASACGGAEVPPVTEHVTTEAPATEPPAPAKLIIAQNKKTEYTIIYDKDEEYGENTAFYLHRFFREKLKVDVDYVHDRKRPADKAEEFEIVLGKADREASKDYRKSIKSGEFIIAAKDNRLYLVGKGEEETRAAVEYFIANMAGSTEGYCAVDTDLFFDSGEELTPVLKWENGKILLSQGGYARMTTLKNGELAVGYSNGGIKFATSSDSGKTWKNVVTVTKSARTPLGDVLTYANANVIQYGNGDIMVAYRAHSPTNTSKNFYTSIRYQISKDGGKTFGEPVIVVEYQRNDKDFKGFWEPHMVILPDGRLAMYYANDCVGPQNADYPYVPSGSYQHIMVHIFDYATEKFDGGHIASNGVDHKSRDGMPVVCSLSDGGMVMVIEANNNKNYRFVIQMLFSADGINWSDPVTVIQPTKNGHYCGAPFVCLLPDGRLAVSCQATQYSGATESNDAVQNSQMNVYISNEPITLENSKTVGLNSFVKVMENPLVMGVESRSIWPAMHVHNGWLICSGDVGSNLSGGVTGIYLRRASLDTIK